MATKSYDAYLNDEGEGALLAQLNVVKARVWAMQGMAIALVLLIGETVGHIGTPAAPILLFLLLFGPIVQALILRFRPLWQQVALSKRRPIMIRALWVTVTALASLPVMAIFAFDMLALVSTALATVGASAFVYWLGKKWNGEVDSAELFP